MPSRQLLPLLLALLAACVRGPAEERRDTTPPPPPADSAPALEIRFLDVGQGDAVLLRSGGRTALVDAGPSDRILRQLRRLGVDTLHLLIASHNHADHLGGADIVLDSIPVRTFLDNGHPASTRIQARVLERVEAKGITYLQATARTLHLGGARLRVVPAPTDVAGDEQNNRSVSVVVEHSGGFRALLTGDSETELLNALLARDLVPRVTLLKAAHHGSRNGVTPAWLSRTAPEVVVISAGAGNSYGHPHPMALRYYCTGGRRVFRTDLHGTVTIQVESDGGYGVETEREADGCGG